MAMVKCEHCGKSVSDSENVCPFCDEEIRNSFVCPNCNSKNITLSDVGDDPNKVKRDKMVGASNRWGGFVGGLTALFVSKKMYPDAKDSQIEYICNDCNYKFRRY